MYLKRAAAIIQMKNVDICFQSAFQNNLYINSKFLNIVS